MIGCFFSINVLISFFLKKNDQKINKINIMEQAIFDYLSSDDYKANKFVYSNRQWWQYDGVVYQIVSNLVVRSSIYATYLVKKQRMSHRQIKEIEDELQTVLFKPNTFDDNRGLLAWKNGVTFINESGKIIFRMSDPSDMLSMSTDQMFVKSNEPRVTLGCHSQIVELIRSVLCNRLLNYVIKGGPSSGKSTILNIITQCLGDYCINQVALRQIPVRFRPTKHRVIIYPHLEESSSLMCSCLDRDTAMECSRQKRVYSDIDTGCSNIFLAYEDEELLVYDKCNVKVEFKVIRLLEKIEFDPRFEFRIPSIVKTIINDLLDA